MFGDSEEREKAPILSRGVRPGQWVLGRPQVSPKGCGIKEAEAREGGALVGKATRARCCGRVQTALPGGLAEGIMAARTPEA